MIEKLVIFYGIKIENFLFVWVKRVLMFILLEKILMDSYVFQLMKQIFVGKKVVYLFENYGGKKILVYFNVQMRKYQFVLENVIIVFLDRLCWYLILEKLVIIVNVLDWLDNGYYFNFVVQRSYYIRFIKIFVVFLFIFIFMNIFN